jgi:hypothetical protein
MRYIAFYPYSESDQQLNSLGLIPFEEADELYYRRKIKTAADWAKKTGAFSVEFMASFLVVDYAGESEDVDELEYDFMDRPAIVDMDIEGAVMERMDYMLLRCFPDGDICFHGRIKNGWGVESPTITLDTLEEYDAQTY